MIDEPVKEVMKFWNSLFDETLNLTNLEYVEMVRVALEKFSKNDLIKAVHFRSK